MALGYSMSMAVEMSDIREMRDRISKELNGYSVGIVSSKALEIVLDEIDFKIMIYVYDIREYGNCDIRVDYTDYEDYKSDTLVDGIDKEIDVIVKLGRIRRIYSGSYTYHVFDEDGNMEYRSSRMMSADIESNINSINNDLIDEIKTILEVLLEACLN